MEQITKELLVNDIRNLGFKKGDKIFMHSSLKSIGIVEGGANTLIDAFLEVLEYEGLLSVPTHTPNCYMHVKGIPFNPKETPSEVGHITDTLFRRKDAFRSKHPTRSVAAIGSLAHEFVKGHENTSTFGKDGPHGRYIKWGAYLVFLGVGLRCNTTLHVIEDWLNLPYMVTTEAAILQDDGSSKTITVYKAPLGHRDFYTNDISKVEKVIIDTKLMKGGNVGNARVKIMKSSDCVEIITRALKNNPDLLLCDNQKCEFCQDSKKKLNILSCP